MDTKQDGEPRSKKMRRKRRLKAVKMCANSIDLLSSDDDAEEALLLLGLDIQYISGKFLIAAFVL